MVCFIYLHTQIWMSPPAPGQHSWRQLKMRVRPALDGTGSAEIAILPNLGAGQYYLLAQDHATQHYIAQTVAFYL